MKKVMGCLAILTVLGGCGYTSGVLLPNNIRTIYVENFRNRISPDVSSSYQFQPGIEIDVTNEIINRYVFDGNLKIAREQEADAILTGELIDYIKDPIRFADNNEDVEQYRLTLVVNIRLTDQRTGEAIFVEPSFAGDTLYFTSGPRTKTEEAALPDAIADLAKNVVDRTIENW